jgi:pyruvate dehydrogenase E2 component (dihydrolipoamide acetyltransferase)
MPTPIAMPKLGMSMQEGRVVAWPLALGAAVARGQIVLVIESEKAEVEIEATASGFLRHLYVAVDATVPCGTLLGAIVETQDEGFDAESFRIAHDHPEAPRASATAAPHAATAPEVTTPRGARKPIAPAARARARELGVDPERVPGSGPGGRVTREDIEAWAARHEHCIEVAPGVALEVPATGRGDSIVLLPGFGTDVAVFARQVPALESSFRVLGVNPRGVAGSDAPPADSYDVARMAEDAACAFDGRAHIIGASLGAAVALELALAHPGRVRSLVLVTPFVAASPRLIAVLTAWCRLAAEASPEALASALVPWLFGAATLADERIRSRNVRGLAEIVARVPAATLVRQAAGLLVWSGTRGADLVRISVPTLVVAGGDDLLAPDAAAVARAIPGAEFFLVPGAGHAVALEDYEAVNEAILAHLSRSESDSHDVGRGARSVAGRPPISKDS